MPSRASRVAAAVLGVLFFDVAIAAPVSYTTRTSFDAAVGPTTTQNFNSVTTDQSFETAAVTVGTLTFRNSGTVANSGLTQKIDAPPLDGGIDGTTYVLADLATNTLRIDFAGGVTAFGADFFGVSDPPRSERIDIFDASDALLGSVIVPGAVGNNQLSFFGFSLTSGFADHIVFTNTGGPNDVFGIDNVAFAPAAVPEPGTLALAGLAFVAGAAARRRRSG